MEKNEIIIMFYNERVYFNWDLFVPFENTNIPLEYMTYPRQRQIFSKVEMLNYNSENQSLSVSVIRSGLTDITGFNNQTPKRVIEKLLFQNFESNNFEPFLEKSNEHVQAANHFNFNQIDSSPIQIEDKPNIITIKEVFRVNFNDSHFILGYVTFNRYIKQLDRIVDFKIANENILAEFDNIKLWFAKVLKIKKIKVTATIVLTENGISKTHALSEDIDEITPELIESVKYERTYSLSKATGIAGFDKLLFTTEDIFAQLNYGDIEGNVFNQSDEDILNFFVQEKNIRNKKQLEYLAGKKQSENQKLRYTLNPDFGFLFMIEGTKYNHYVWELLNSNATYLWRIEKNDNEIELQFERIEAEVNKVRTFKRANYKKAYKNDHQDTDIGFLLISHEDIISNPADNFSKWKIKLNEQLT